MNRVQHFDFLKDTFGAGRHDTVAEILEIDPRVYRRWRREGFASRRQAEMVSMLLKNKLGVIVPPGDLIAKKDQRTERHNKAANQ